MFCLQGLDEGKAWPGPPLTSCLEHVCAGHACMLLPDPCLLSSKRRGMLGTERRSHRRPPSFRNAQLMRKQRGSASLRTQEACTLRTQKRESRPRRG